MLNVRASVSYTSSQGGGSRVELAPIRIRLSLDKSDPTGRKAGSDWQDKNGTGSDPQKQCGYRSDRIKIHPFFLQEVNIIDIIIVKKIELGGSWNLYNHNN